MRCENDYDQDGDGYESIDYGGDDCDDLDATINPGMDTWYDGIDSDCSGVNDYDQMGMDTPLKVLKEMTVMTLTPAFIQVQQMLGMMALTPTVTD